MIRSLAAVFCCVLLFSCTNKPAKTDGGLAPQQALGTFQLPEGFSIELVANEPLIADPVAMEIDEDGNLYVVEMHGYPEDITGNGAIKLLTDTDGDGRPDKSTVFAENLRLPTGIMRWKKGVLVVDVPDLLYLEDSDGDGKADLRNVVITGMALTNPQHITNTPLYGLDNWIYLAHMGTITPKVSMLFSDSGSGIRFADKPDAPALPRNADGRNMRLKPDRHLVEMLSGESQYGHSFDNWGHHFCVENADHLFHEVIPARYLQRNPALLLADASAYISDHGDACAVYPITINPENQLLTDRGVVTSACGITWYNGGLFPDSFSNVTFVCEPTSNLVHADRITESGATFTASRLYEQKEFLASTDGWFRPVQQYIGPDGALYVLDYYRQIIEHPEWLSEEVIQSGALYNGSRQGRIYRIAPTGAPKMQWCNNLQLGKATTDGLVAALLSDNIWWRRQAQRLLMDRKDITAITGLKTVVRTSPSATAVVHALWCLDGLEAMDEASLLLALKSPHAGVRENAVQLAEQYLPQFNSLAAVLPSLSNDSSAKVRFQLLCTLGEIRSEQSAVAQQQLLLQGIEDQWVQTAALSSAAGNEWSLLQKTLPVLIKTPTEAKASFVANCAALIALSGDEPALKNVFATAFNRPSAQSDWWQSALLRGVSMAATAKDLRLPSATRDQLLSRFSKTTPPGVRRASLQLLLATTKDDETLDRKTATLAREVAAQTTEPAAYREDAVRLLALDKEPTNVTLTQQLITGEEPIALQQAAVKTYQRQNEKQAAAFLIKNWSLLSGGVKEAALDALFSSADTRQILLDAVEKKIIATTDISWPRKVALMNHDNESIRVRSRKLLAGEIGGREEAYKQYLPALNLKGDTAKGRTVFQQVCGACHLYEGKQGNLYGPDIATVRNRDKASIMKDILDPNRSIAVKYDLWTITLKNGTKKSGIISAETPAAITLAQAGGPQETISRSSIRNMETTGVSAMPAGLEAALTKEEMAHLLAFITGKQ